MGFLSPKAPPAPPPPPPPPPPPAVEGIDKGKVEQEEKRLKRRKGVRYHINRFWINTRRRCNQHL